MENKRLFMLLYGKTIKNIIYIVLTIIIIGFFVITVKHIRLKKFAEQSVMKQKIQNEREEEEKKKQLINSTIKDLVSKSNAYDGWENQLSNGKRVRIKPIWTLELEKAWIIDRPILFKGTIKDISTLDDAYCRVIIERNDITSDPNHCLFNTKLRLSLSSAKTLIDNFLAESPNFISYDNDFNYQVAVIAQIRKIKTAYITDLEEGLENEVRIGEGELFDIVNTEEIAF